MKRPRLLPFIVIIQSVLLVAALGYAFTLQKENTNLRKPEYLPKLTAERIHKDIRDTVAVPANEVPVVLGTVADPTKLEDQVFYRNALQGDVIVVYTEAKIAVLYRESEKKVINIGPFQTDDTAPTVLSTPVTTAVPAAGSTLVP
jgi:hypothetical protein